MATIVITKGLTESEYESIKEAAKNAIPFRVTFRYHKQGYCYGSIDIRPTLNNGLHQWTEEQFNSVRSFTQAYNLTTSQDDIMRGPSAFYCFKGGVNYLYRIEKQISC